MNVNFTVNKVLNNNVIIAQSSAEEVVFIGKGIGFGKRPGDPLEKQAYDKVFKLVNEEEQEKYKRLLSKEEEETILIIHEAIEKVRELLRIELHERIHYALAQHLVLAIERTRNNAEIHNPFLVETKWLYADTYKVAGQVIDFLHWKTGVRLPEAEAGFITLHIQSASTDRLSLKLNETGEFISRCISYAEEKTGCRLDRESVEFRRFVEYLKQLFERNMTNEYPGEEKVLQLLKSEDPLCYNIARNIVRMVEKTVDHHIARVETIYTTIHLQRLITKP